MDIEEMKDRLETLLNSRPETGEQWAEICRLEQQIVDAEQDAAERAYERQCERFYGGNCPLPLREQMTQARGIK